MTHCGDFLQMELVGATQIMHIPKPFQFFYDKERPQYSAFLYRCFIGKCSEMYETFWPSLWLGHIIRIKLHIKQAPCCLFCSLLGLSCEIKDNRNTANCLTTSRAGGLDLRTLLVHKSRRSAMQQRGGLIDTQTHREKGIRHNKGCGFFSRTGGLEPKKAPY